MFEQRETGVVRCGDLKSQSLWDPEDCCPDCHAENRRCTGMVACVVYLSERVEMEVCCAVLERMSPGWRPTPLAAAVGW